MALTPFIKLDKEFQAQNCEKPLEATETGNRVPIVYSAPKAYCFMQSKAPTQNLSTNYEQCNG